MNLSIQRSFVVQLSDKADPEHSRFCGRIEHVTSGKAARFRSLEEMALFLAERIAESPDTSRTFRRRGTYPRPRGEKRPRGGRSDTGGMRRDPPAE